jgi:NitT/TauT family transport system substrate-binding protein
MLGAMALTSVVAAAALAVAVAGPPSALEYLPLRIAAAGPLAANGQPVELREVRSEALAAEALADGKVALAATSLDAALRMGHARGKPPRLVAALTSAPALALVVAAAETGVQELEDLRGRRIGTTGPGSPGAQALETMLARRDLSLSHVTTVSLDEPALVAALARGTLAAAVLSDPWISRLIQDGQGRALIDLRRRADQVRWLGAETVHIGVFARADTTLGAAELDAVRRALAEAISRARTAAPESLLPGLPSAVRGLPADWPLRVMGARETYRTGAVTTDLLDASIDLVKLRAPLPAAVKLPRDLSELLAPTAAR